MLRGSLDGSGVWANAESSVWPQRKTWEERQLITVSLMLLPFSLCHDSAGSFGS